MIDGKENNRELFGGTNPQIVWDDSPFYIGSNPWNLVSEAYTGSITRF
jgi:hypothetical protein